MERCYFRAMLISWATQPICFRGSSIERDLWQRIRKLGAKISDIGDKMS